MDIASRLKIYLEHSGLQSTQFADMCGIPRPSFSQLLRGRNRKVSDEVITKIHDAFPKLSVLWLMFGEGEMETSGNTRFSEPENGSLFTLGMDNKIDNEDVTSENNRMKNPLDFPSSIHLPSLSGIENGELENTDNKSERNCRVSAPASVSGQESRTRFTKGDIHEMDMQFASGNEYTESRRVVSIMVFYSDKSFETFVPEK